MGYVGELPGMYYDHEKNKYFKIQPNSAGPATSAYSSQDVKRRRLHEEKEAEASRDRERQKRRVRSSKILQEPLIGGFLQREGGHDGFEPARIFARGLTREGYFLVSEQDARTEGSGIFTISQKPGIEPSMIDFTTVTGGFIQHSRIDLKRSDTSSQNCQFADRGYSEDMIPERPRTSDITSACVHETSQLHATTWLSSSARSGIMISDAGIEEMDDLPQNRRLIEMGAGLSRGLEVYIFSSAPAPPTSDLLFVFGTSAGVIATDKQGYYNTIFVTPVVENRPDDIFAVEFLSETPSVLLSGGRRGILNITDLRLPMPPLDNDTISHPSSITHIRQIDQHRLIVSGLNSSLCQYDLRFRKTSQAPTGPIIRQKRRTNTRPTNAILQYPDYHNTASHQAGFDIDHESGIVAAAQEADAYHPSVQLFSLHGGHKLDSPHTYGFQYKNETDWLVKCLRFARDTDSGMKSLYVGQRPIVQRYAWGEHDPENATYGGPSSLDRFPTNYSKRFPNL